VLIATAVLVALVWLVGMTRSSSSSMSLDSSFSLDRAQAAAAVKDARGGFAPRIKHHSYPDELPVFLGKGNLGNFEPKEPEVAPAGPGAGGKAHVLRVEQKGEEDRLKGVYGFNQLVSDEISLNRTVPELREDECR
jgi:hypothetical protein